MQLSILIRTLEESGRLNFTDRRVAGIANDSRKIGRDYLFVAISGHKLDGHRFIQDAVGSGANTIVTERPVFVDSCIAQIVVENGRKALSRLSSCFYGEPSRRMNLIGVTGTNGKTTTTFLIKSILEVSLDKQRRLNGNGHETSPAGYSADVGLIGTIRYAAGQSVLPARETTPESVDLQALLARMVELNIGYAVMEVSSQSLVQYRTDDVEFAAGVFTNLTPEHLDYHCGISGYMAAKLRLFSGLSGNAFAILNADDGAGRYFADGTEANVVWYGINNRSDVGCRILDCKAASTDILLSYRGDEIEVELPMIGRHNVYNALAAAATCLAMGVGIEAVKKGLCVAETVPGRLEAVECGQGFRVFVDYAHTAHALISVLQSLRETKAEGGRLLLVFGCGGERDKGKRAEMGMAAERLADRFWITSDNPRGEDPGDIIADIEGAVEHSDLYVIEPDRRSAINDAINEARDSDTVLIAGKGHETGQIVGDRVLPFDDRMIAREALVELCLKRRGDADENGKRM